MRREDDFDNLPSFRAQQYTEEGDILRSHMSAAGIEWSMAIRTCSRSWVATTCAHVTLVAGFKKCCMASGRFDGSERGHYLRKR